jgi:hypothetical protein
MICCRAATIDLLEDRTKTEVEHFNRFAVMRECNERGDITKDLTWRVGQKRNRLRYSRVSSIRVSVWLYKPAECT